MQTILTWLGRYNISTHTLAVLALALTAAYTGYKPFHDLVTGIFTGLPTPVQVLIGTGGFLYALYKTGALKGAAQPSAVTGTGNNPYAKVTGQGPKLGCWALIGLLLLSGVSTVPLTGCAFTKAALEAYAADVDTAVAEIAGALGDAPLAATIKADLAQFDSAVNAWQGGSVTAEIISATKILEIALGDVGLSPVVVDAADVAINILDTILAGLPGAKASAVAPAIQAHAAVAVRGKQGITYHSRAAAVAAFNRAALADGLKPIK
jgi:hypothetical protein